MPEIALPGAWWALAFLLRGWRSMPSRTGLTGLALLLYAALAAADRGSVPVNGPLYLVLVAGLTVLFLIPFILDRWLAARISGWASTIVFPMALVALELLRSRMPAGPATWYSLAYTQYGNLPLMQLAALTGIWGISFLLGWFASTVNRAWERGFDWTASRRVLLTYAGLFAAILAGGALRLALPSSPSLTIRAATVTFPRDLFTQGEMFRIADGRIPVTGPVAAKLARLHDWFFESTEREARAGARVVAWPEMNFLVRADEEPAALDRAQRLAVKEQIYLAMAIGAVRPGAPKPFENKTVLVDPSGRIAYSYAKSLPVMGWEESVMRPGDGHLPVAATALGRLSAAICFEGDHPDFLRQAGIGRADLFILPVNDWAAVKDVHLRMAAFRAIENGAPLLRPASFGASAAFDPLGRLLGQTDHFSGGPSLVAEIPVGHVPTLYPLVGDLFGWLCAAGTVLAALVAWSRARSAAAAIRAPSLSPV